MKLYLALLSLQYCIDQKAVSNVNIKVNESRCKHVG